jgi:proton-coupled amino acid transporter
MAEAKGAAAPLLAREDSRGRGGAAGGGGATSAQTLGNVVVSIVGTGVLGLPYAFRAAGWVAGSIGVAVAGCATLYCMLLLVSTVHHTTYPSLHCFVLYGCSFPVMMRVYRFN